MNKAAATSLFSASLAIRGIIDFVGAAHALKHLLIGLVLATCAASLSFWLGARRGRESRWYLVVFAAVAVFAIGSFLPTLFPPLSRWTFVFIVGLSFAVPAFVAGRVVGRRPLAPTSGAADPQHGA